MTLVLPKAGVSPSLAEVRSSLKLTPFKPFAYCASVKRTALVPSGRTLSSGDCSSASSALNAECSCGCDIWARSSCPVALRRKSVKPLVSVSTLRCCAMFVTSSGDHFTSPVYWVLYARRRSISCGGAPDSTRSSIENALSLGLPSSFLRLLTNLIICGVSSLGIRLPTGF